MKFDRILFPIDFSERSCLLNKDVEWMATRFGSRVTLLHVFEIPAAWYGSCEASFIDPDLFTAVADSARDRVKRYSINVPESRVERVVGEGDVAGHITDWVAEHDIDLIMMSTHGYGKVRGLLLGSVAAKVIHDVSCPVWTDSMLRSHAERHEPEVSSITCAIEMTEETIPLLRFTQELAKDFGAKVQVIHSVPEAETRPNKYFDFDLHRYLADSARVNITKLQREAGTDFPLVVSGAPISEAVSAAALESKAGLIVIGRGKAQEALGRLRTHAYQIIRDAPCPVLSYSLNQPDRISSSCTAEHPAQYAGDGRPQIGSRTT